MGWVGGGGGGGGGVPTDYLVAPLGCDKNNIFLHQYLFMGFLWRILSTFPNFRILQVLDGTKDTSLETQ